MIGARLVLDTNVIIRDLKESNSKYAYLINENDIVISIITKIELLGFPNITSIEEEAIKDYLSIVNIKSLDTEVSNLAIELKKKYRIRTPDAIIASTAIIENLPLISEDSDFERVDELTLIKIS